MSRKKRKKRSSQRGIYILPNLFTSANLFCGFYAIIAAIQGSFVESAIAIMVAALFDGLDGKIARVTRTVSQFGLEYDSLSDAISFGVAPGILVYLWALQPFGRVGWLGAFVFVACGTLRLARFNTLAGRVSGEYFVGLPIPTAAFMVAATVLLLDRIGGAGASKHVTIPIMIYVLSFLMVSTIKYHSFKKASLFKQMKFNMLVLVVLVCIVIAAEPSISFFLMAFVYILSGPFTALWFRRKKNAEEHVSDQPENTPSEESL
ncbi:MAG: CDP-diacylglycerol--serine O-phosphatidyltransferase [Deltaproteobacteria bacterium]|nr:CDP-diacylglycerol--serine O-phosphatidyltransferase [Deltaproteobacteria bacterium]